MSTTRSIALVGLSGAGKSSVARLLAGRLGWELADTDALAERAAGRAIPQIFAEQGEQGFRDIEERALAEALAGPPRVVATGGGAVLRERSRALLRQRCLVVWLDAPTEELLARLRAHDEERPLLASGDPAARLEAMRAARAPLYAEVADLRLATAGAAPEQLADQIIAALNQTAAQL